MLGVLFDFRGRVDRTRYLAALSAAFFATIIVVAAILLALRLAFPWAFGVGSALASLLGLLAFVWAGLALQSKRLRDAAFEPWVVVPGVVAIGVLDYLLARARPGWALFPDSPDTLLGLVSGMAVLAVLVFHPGRWADEETNPVARGVGLLVLAAAAGLVVFIAVPPSVISNRILPKPIRQVYVASLLERGHGEYDKGRYREALADYQRAVDLAPGSPIARMDRGIARQALHDYAGAKADYEQALALDPRYANAHINLAILARDMNDLPGALREMDIAVRLAPDNPQALAKRAWVRASLRHPEGALQDIERAAALAPRDRKIAKLRDDLRRALR